MISNSRGGNQMNVQPTTRNGLLLVLALVAATAALFTGYPTLAQGSTPTPCPFGNGTLGGMMGGGMMGGGEQLSSQPCAQFGTMPNMMGGSDLLGNITLGGMMMGGVPDANGTFGPGSGMMGAWMPPADLLPAAGKTLTLDQAVAIAKAYIAAWTNVPKLGLNEVMQFSNNFYEEAVETDTGRGAFEFLIDPTTGTTYPEPGPNMMWNLRYGTIGPYRGISPSSNPNETMPITPDQAVKSAQAYLDSALPGTTAETQPFAFYGYYTLHILRSGKIIGMLSVNGYTGQVWPHTWPGAYITMTGEQ
jgi:hypothetical protein